MDEPTRSPALERLEPFVGEWDVDATFPSGGITGVTASSVFEWILDGQFLVQRSEVSHPAAPNGFSVVGVDADGETYTQHYFDSRGVARLYNMTFEDGEWTLMRTSADFTPLHFQQRFIGRFSEDGNTIEGQWQTSDDRSTWKLDFDLTYTRRR